MNRYIMRIKIAKRLLTLLLVTNYQIRVRASLTISAMQKAIYRYKCRPPVFITLIDSRIFMNEIISKTIVAPNSPAPINVSPNPQVYPSFLDSNLANEPTKIVTVMVIA